MGPRVAVAGDELAHSDPSDALVSVDEWVVANERRAVGGGLTAGTIPEEWFANWVGHRMHDG
jgi:hypothetical protein